MIDEPHRQDPIPALDREREKIDLPVSASRGVLFEFLNQSFSTEMRY